ncbi:hypothetical protein G9A89_014672 [Geosiphon pyriformis]|nr:hypothetical protein G9A89_014672 [Geosiphon pyriformis]
MPREPILKLSIINIDSYLASPGPWDLKCSFTLSGKSNRVPVVRIFGRTQSGQRACLHVHQAFPYLYIPYTGSLEPIEAQQYIHQFGKSLDRAVSLVYNDSNDSRFTQYVAAIILVKGVPFYDLKSRVAELLQLGSIMGCKFQPYEAHIPFLLQFMVDYNLFGMNYIHLSDVMFRQLPLTPNLRSDHDNCNPLAFQYFSHIINRDWIQPRDIHHNLWEGSLSIYSDRLLSSLNSLWEDESRRRKARGLELPNVVAEFSSASEDDRIPQPLRTVEDDELLQKLSNLNLMCNKEESIHKIQDFLHKTDSAAHIPTVYEAVEALYFSEKEPEIKTFYDSYKEDQGFNSLNNSSLRVIINEEIISRAKDCSGEIEEEESEDELSANPILIEKQGLQMDDAEKKDELDEALLGLLRRKTLFAENSDGAPHQSEIQQDDTNFLKESKSYPSKLGKENLENCRKFSQQSQQNSNLASTSPKPRITSNKIISIGTPASPSSSGNFLIPTNSIGSQDSKARLKRTFSQSSSTLSDIEHEDKLVNHRERHCHYRDQAFPLGELSQSQKTTFFDPLQPTQRIKDTVSKNSITGMVTKFITRNTKLKFDCVEIPFSDKIHLASYKPVGLRIKNKNIHNESGGINCFENDSNDPNTILEKDEKKSVGQINAVEMEKVSAKYKIPKDNLIHICVPLNSFESPLPTIPNLFIYRFLPPTTETLLESLSDFDLPYVIYQEPHFTDISDIPEKPRIYAGKEFKIKAQHIKFMNEFNTYEKNEDTNFIQGLTAIEADLGIKSINTESTAIREWTFYKPPPSQPDMMKFLKDEKDHLDQKVSIGLDLSILNISKDHQTRNYPMKTGVYQVQESLGIFSLEIHVNTRGNILPDPREDSVTVIFWCLQSPDHAALLTPGKNEDWRNRYRQGILMLEIDGFDIDKIGLHGIKPQIFRDELSMYKQLVKLVRDFDPDILAGYEIHNSSWGYIIKRGLVQHEINLCHEFSRIIITTKHRNDIMNDAWGLRKASAIHVVGRHVLNIWRIIRGQMDLNIYTYQNVVWHLLHERVPHYSNQTMTLWFTHGPTILKCRVFNHYLDHVKRNIDILNKSHFINRTSEFSQIFGIDFYSVLSRGSQFKVESIMLRIAKPESFVLISPSREQVANQRAAECIPLIMEPQPEFYNSPILVLDFQSLYPSIMIAYNYCYSTCLGKLELDDETSNVFGVTTYNREDALLLIFKDYLNVAPNGLIYVKPHVRKSLLAKMLKEILDTRIMLKKSMGLYKDDKNLCDILDARQLGLKYLANVTYGYTGATFSGRMPCVDIADSIVQTGRETLEKAVDLIHFTKRWGAKVVYGDTDSLFVYLPGRSKDQAFEIGNEIAEAVTQMNPKPVKLKFEKVYLPSILLAKKRYIGFKFETKNDLEAELDAKGMELIRRDGVQITRKLMEECIRLLFRTQNLSEIKIYLEDQWARILSGRVSIKDFIFSKEVKFGTYADGSHLPPGAILSTRRMAADYRTEPQYGERVPYVVVRGAPGERLINRIVSPDELASSRVLRLDGHYYISKQIIPAIARIFNLVGVDIETWYEKMPRTLNSNTRHSAGINFYYWSGTCINCGANVDSVRVICEECVDASRITAFQLQKKLQHTQRRFRSLVDICAMCSRQPTAICDIACDSMDCPVFFERAKAKSELRMEQHVNELVEDLLEYSLD